MSAAGNKAYATLFSKTALAGAVAGAGISPQSYGNTAAWLSDSHGANASRFDKGMTIGTLAEQSWRANSIFAQLIALSGGRIKPISSGYPANDGVNGPLNSVAKLAIANGGSGYSAGTYLSFDANSGGSGAAGTVTITNGVITAATLTARGSSYSQQPAVSVIDPLGTGSGAVIAAPLAGIGTFATGGMNAEEIEALLPDALASGAFNIFIMAVSNTLATGTPVPPHRPMDAARLKASLIRMARAVIAAGKRPIMVFPPNPNKAGGTNSKKFQYGVRRWFMTELPNIVPGTVVVDAFAALTDAVTDDWPTGYLQDNLHVAPVGGFQAAKVIWPRIAPYFPGDGLLTVSSDIDRYDAALVPDGNLLTAAQSCMSNAATTTVDTPFTGTKMTGLAFKRGLPNSVGALTGSATGAGTMQADIVQQTSPRRGYAQRLALNLTGCTADETYRIQWGSGTGRTLNVTGGNILQLNDRIRAALDQVTFGAMSGIKEVKFYIALSDSNVDNRFNVAGWGFYPAAAGLGPNYSGETLWMPTREIDLVSSSASILGVTAYFDIVTFAGAANITVDLFGASIAKVLQ